MSSFEVLSWGSIEKLSPFVVERDSLDLVLKPSENSDSFRVTLTQLEKPFKVLLQFPRASYIQVQFTIVKIFLSVNCTVMNGIFKHLYINSTKICLPHWPSYSTGHFVEQY